MNRRLGFTLFELLLAIALLMALVFTLLPASHQIMSSSIRAAERSDQISQLSILTDIVERSMFTLVATDADGNPGLVVTETSLKLVSCGVALHNDEVGDADDLQSVEISHSDNQLRIRSGNGEWSGLLSGVERVDFAFYDGDAWQSGGGQSEAAPSAVAISVWFGAPEPEGDIDLEQPADLEEDDREPHWRRVFSVLDPASAQTSSAVVP